MTEKIMKNLYRVEVPLPNNPLRTLNSYILMSPTKNLIIDTGMNRPECKEVLYGALDNLEVDLRKTDFFITHLHADHSGLASGLLTETSNILMSQLDGDVIKLGEPWNAVAEFAGTHGFPKGELQEAIKKHPGNKYSSQGRFDYHEVNDGDEVHIGDFRFRCVLTPGHTNGHMCLYEAQKKILISGDHILNDITPNISLSLEKQGNPLLDYLISLDKVSQLDVELVLPGHRRIFTDHNRRIAELKTHHDARNGEILNILASDSGNSYQIASQMTWDLDCSSWEAFPIPQKWFATGEAMAHLKYLEEKGKVRRCLNEGINVYSLA